MNTLHTLQHFTWYLLKVDGENRSDLRTAQTDAGGAQLSILGIGAVNIFL